jgi:CelD/BcsL family acetyltransferase involved in cellulose biosynthesis
VDLNYSLGDVSLFRFRFRALVETNRIDRPQQAPDALASLPECGAAVYFGAKMTCALPSLRFMRSAIRYIRNQRKTYFIDLSASFDEYVRGFQSKTRKKLQRSVKKIMALNGFECCLYRAPDSAAEFHRIARQIAEKTYQERLFQGALPASQQFVSALCAKAQLDLFRGFILVLDQQPVAYICCLADDVIVHYAYVGYDPQFSDLSPGTVLLYLALEHLFAERKHRFLELGSGEGQLKQVFGRSSVLCGDVYFFRWTASNVAAVLVHVAVEGTSSLLGKTLSAIGLRQRIRKGLRTLRSKVPGVDTKGQAPQ